MTTQLNHETRREYEIRTARDFAEATLRAGYRPFLAENGNYGFYTDTEGTRVVSFQVNGYFESSVSGNYVTDKPGKTGTGWRIADSMNPEAIDTYFAANPPRWATGDAKTRLATLDDELARYHSSSKYEELTA